MASARDCRARSTWDILPLRSGRTNRGPTPRTPHQTRTAKRPGECSPIIAHCLTAVGFSSPPSWIKPYHVLSNGERFRCDLARALLAGGKLVAYDEFTSVVDRTVAKIGSAAVAKAIRAGKINRQFVAVTCHYDIVEWLAPDWVLDMATCQLARSCLRRPSIRLEIAPVHRSAWSIFRPHHYLNTSISVGAHCFAAFWHDEPVAFSSWVHRMTRTRRPNDRREHRTVVLPDYQGVGIGNRVSEFCASIIRGVGGRAFSTTSHPAMIRYRSASPLWRRQRLGMAMPNGRTGIMDNYVGSVNRITAGFEYVGPPLDRDHANALWNAHAGEFEPKATRLAVLALVQARSAPRRAGLQTNEALDGNAGPDTQQVPRAASRTLPRLC